MARYVVTFGTDTAAPSGVVLTRVRARTPQDAYQRAVSDQFLVREHARWVSVTRRGLLPRRTPRHVTFAGSAWPGDGPGGTAGVREPRRPKPTPPSLRVEREEP